MDPDPGDLAPCSIAIALREAAGRRGDDLAVTDRHHRWTFSELEDRVARLAGTIVEQSEPGTRWVPVVATRSAHSVVAIHAVIRAGRPLALIDASIPTAGRQDLMERLGSPSLVIDTTDPEVLDTRNGIDPRPVSADEPGLVIFTSGSTGRPKGVVHSWATLDAYLERRRERARTFGISHSMEPSPFGFLAGLMQSIQPAVGVTIGIVDPTTLTLDQLLDQIDAEGFDAITIVPSLAAALARRPRPPRRLMSVRRIFSYGEPLRWEHVPTLRALAHPEATIEIPYASSESPVGILKRSIGPDDPIGVGRVPFEPIGDRGRVRVIPVPEQEGLTEIAVGPPITVGYLDDAELDRLRFTTVDGRRVWRSGDLARVDADGRIHLCGRVDDLVKISGKLVEPSESEEVLRALPEIDDAVVLPSERSDGSLRLVAHVVTAASARDLDPVEIRRRLEARLPRHVVPAVMVRHDELPVGDAGKVDRRALHLTAVAPWRRTPPRSPGGEHEWFLTTTLAAMLDLPEVGPDDDVWYLGLDSLGAAELAARITDAGLGDLALEGLLVDRTPASIAARLRASVPDRRSSLVILNPDGSPPPIVALPGGGATALSVQALGLVLGTDQPIVVIEPRGMHLPGAPDRTIEAAAERAHRLLTDAGIVPSSDRLVVVGHSAGAIVGYELCQRLSATGAEVHLVMVDTAPIPVSGASAVPNGRGMSGRIGVGRAGRMLIGAGSSLVRKLRGRSLPEIVRLAWARAASWRYSVLPGRPSTSPRRYRGLGDIARRAARRYRAEPAGFPATLFVIEGSTAAGNAAVLINDLEIRSIGGDHRSCIELPHVAVIGERIRRLRTADAPEPS